MTPDATSLDGPADRPAVTFRVVPGPFEAAVVDGLDPRVDATDPSVCAWLRALLWDHGVVCLRQPERLTDDALRAVVAMIGDVKDPIGRAVDGRPIRYSEARQVIDSGFVLTDELRAELGDVGLGGDDERPGLFQFFHTDDSYVECPAAATVLHARALPSSGGGDTCFIDMRAAFDLLEPAVRARIVGLHAAHAYNNRDAFPPRPSATGELEALADVSHPIVRAHPVTGRPALFFDLDRAVGIEGMPDDDGRALLQSLQDHAEHDGPRYCHAWQANDVLLWDNASVQHRASGDFVIGEARRFWRYMVDGHRPIAFDGSR